MSPEYALEGLFSIKSDVFSFGVLLLEIVSGRKNTGFYQTDSFHLLGYVSILCHTFYCKNSMYYFTCYLIIGICSHTLFQILKRITIYFQILLRIIIYEDTKQHSHANKQKNPQKDNIFVYLCLSTKGLLHE